MKRQLFAVLGIAISASSLVFSPAVTPAKAQSLLGGEGRGGTPQLWCKGDAKDQALTVGNSTNSIVGAGTPVRLSSASGWERTILLTSDLAPGGSTSVKIDSKVKKCTAEIVQRARR